MSIQELLKSDPSGDRHDPLKSEADAPTPSRQRRKGQPLARLGRWAHNNRRRVAVFWLILAISLGFFAPKLEHALSGAMWEVNGSESLEARQIIEDQFGGLSSQSAVIVIHSDSNSVETPEFQATIAGAVAVLDSEDAFGPALPPMPGADGQTVMIQAGSLVNPTEAVRAAERIHDAAGNLSTIDEGGDITVALTGSPAFWADFNEVNRQGMMKAEILTWPVTAVILIIAFGTLAAAGLPLLLTAGGLLSSMGVLYGITQFTDLSVWTLNFAMMFALALGIDYALFIVTRFRAAMHTQPDDINEAVGVTMDTAGKAVAFSGLTVLISLSAILLVPIPAFRTMAAGMMLSVSFVLLAGLTLLPAMLGPGIDRFAMPWHSVGDHRSKRFEAFAERIRARKGLVAVGATVVLLGFAAPLIGLSTGMPSISVLPEDEQARQGYDMLSEAFGPGGPGPVQIVVPAGIDPAPVAAQVSGIEGIAMAFPPAPGAEGAHMINAVSAFDPSSSEAIDLIGTMRDEMPAGVLIGGPVAENHDLDKTLSEKAPIVIAVVLVLGFLLLLLALQGVIVALIGVIFNLLSVGAGFGVGVMAFQHGWLAGVMGFESQGYLTSWAPLFFFALVFAISMDYTVFLLASTREHYESSNDSNEAITGSIAHTGRPILAAAGIMMAVFFTFAIAGTLPMKEMGVILGTAVLFDALMVRLVLVPSVLYLIGDKAWWLPGWLDKILPDVKFSH